MSCQQSSTAWDLRSDMEWAWGSHSLPPFLGASITACIEWLETTAHPKVVKHTLVRRLVPPPHSQEQSDQAPLSETCLRVSANLCHALETWVRRQSAQRQSTSVHWLTLLRNNGRCANVCNAEVWRLRILTGKATALLRALHLSKPRDIAN